MFEHTLSWAAAFALVLTGGTAAAQPAPEPTSPPAPAPAAEPAPVPAPQWSSTFAADALAAHHASASIVVVAAGERDATLARAAEALAAGYRAAGVSLVMDSSGLGDVSALDDRAIVERAAGLPVEDVAILRVFAGAPGEPPRAVVSIHRKSGELVTAFSVVAGEALPAPSEKQDEATAGVSAKVVDRVMQAGDERPAADAQEEYDRRYIGFDTVYVGNGYGVRRFGAPFQGTQRLPLTGADFYEAIGRADLADSYRRRKVLRVVAVGVGAVATVGSIFLFYEGVRADGLSDCSVLDADYDQCEAAWDAMEGERRRRQTYYYVGAGVTAAVGLGAYFWGFFSSPHPVSEAEARSLAEAYNRDLRDSLGLSAEKSPRKTRSGPSIHVSPYVSVDGGGLRVLGRF